MKNFSKETNATKVMIRNLRNSGMLIERVGDDAYNVISTKTGAVLQRLISVVELAQYQRCIEYVAKQHGAAIARHLHTRPAHSVANGY